MFENSFDGSTHATELLGRLAAENRVGESLSADTIRLYARKIKQVVSRTAGGNLEALTPEDAVRDHTSRILEKVITRATARLEKAAILYWLAERAQMLMDSGGPGFERYEAAYKDVVQLTTKDLEARSEYTSGPKLKAFPDEAVDILERAAMTNRSLTLLRSLAFVRANLIVGLRPVEWFNASVVDYQHKDAFGDGKLDSKGNPATSPALLVANAKHSALRSNGESRMILLDGVTPKSMNDLVRWINMSNADGQQSKRSDGQPSFVYESYASMQRTIRKTLMRAGWVGAIPTIYSTRHQAVANAKADGKSQREIAALFGHLSTDTAHRHYGKKFAGYTGRSMNASPETILAVRSAAVRTAMDPGWEDLVEINSPSSRR